MLKRISIVEKYKYQEDANAKTFYTPPNSPSQLTYENEPSWLVGISRQLFTPH
jgi:hypothetical protein